MGRARWVAASVAIASAALTAAACGAALMSPARTGEKLYLAMQVEDGGVVVASPKLLGEVGRPVAMRLVDPARPDRTRLSVVLRPEAQGDGYRVQLEVELPNRPAPVAGELALKHGEERGATLATWPTNLNVKLMLMRVDSPEFDTLMELTRQHSPRNS